MLNVNEKRRIEQRIDKICSGILTDAHKSLQKGVPDKQVVENVLAVTVNKLTPESKMFISSVYNMLAEQTLKKPLFNDPLNEAAFNERDILKDLNRRFDFVVPQDINFEESRKQINKWIASGAIAVVGGVVSISMKSWVPVGVASIIVGILLFVLKDIDNNETHDTEQVISDYLKNVKISMMSWINSIEQYYDEQVELLEKKLGEQND